MGLSSKLWLSDFSNFKILYFHAKLKKKKKQEKKKKKTKQKTKELFLRSCLANGQTDGTNRNKFKGHTPIGVPKHLPVSLHNLLNKMDLPKKYYQNSLASGSNNYYCKLAFLVFLIIVIITILIFFPFFQGAENIK